MFRPLAAVFCLALVAAPASAQSSGSSEEADDTSAIVGAGVAFVPAFEGSKQTRTTIVPGAVGSVHGYKFFLLGNQATVDLIRDPDGPGWDLQLGPAASLGFNRHSVKQIDDPRIRALGEVGLAIQVGGYAGIARQGVITSDYDRLSVTATVVHDVNGAHGGTLISPTISYMTPLSTKAMVSVFATATHADDKYAGTYYTITPAQSVASGLPAFNARGGWSNWMAGAAAMVSLTGDLRHGLQLAAGAAYGRMQGDFADSPVVSVAGSRKQWMAGVGLAYSF